MKMKEQHFETIKAAIHSILNQYPTIAEEYERRNFMGSELVEDLQRRFCFDMLYASKVMKDDDFREEIYQYLNDDHIYTALRRICPEVTKKY